MIQREISGCELAVPAEWLDRSVLVFADPVGVGGLHRNVTVSREPRDGRSLATAADDFRRMLVKAQLPELRFEKRTDGTLNGHPMTDIEITHGLPVEAGSPETTVYRRAVIAITDDTVYNVSLTAVSQEELFSEAFQGILGSVRFPAAR